MMTAFPPDPKRGIAGLFGLGMMTFGASFQWGLAVGFFVLGLFLAIDCASDEAIERITGTKRGWKSTEADR